MTIQALPKTQELTNKINSFFLKKRKLNEFDIRLLKKEAANLKEKIEYADYYDVLGQIASLEQDKASIVKNYENAIKLAPTNERIRDNYLACLANSGFLAEAATQAKILDNKFPNETKLLSFLIVTNFHLCRFNEALQLYKKLEKPPEISGFDKNMANDISDIVEDAELSDDEAQHLCQLAFSLLETQKLYYSGAQIEIIEDCILYTIYVDLPVEKIFEFNWELSGVFASSVEDMRSEVLMIDYSSVEVLEEQQKHVRVI
jgi:tetratricopeptide (TPR) repeat protein